MSLAEEVYNRLVQRGDEWAEAQFQAQQLEDTEKTFLYQLAENLMKDDPKLSASKAEMLARAHTDYHGFVLNKCKVRREANKARTRYDAAKAWCDMTRTEAANARALGG